MKKEDLIKLGLDEELADKVAEASAEELKGFVPKKRFDEVNDAKKQLEADVSERDEQLESLRKVDAEGLEAEIQRLQDENKAKQEKYEAEVKQIKIDNAVHLALTNSKAKNLKAARALLDLENAELDGDSVKGLDEQLKQLMESEESKFLFDTEVKTPALKGASPGQSANPDNKKVDVTKMNYEELAAYMEQNPDAEV